MTLAVGRTSVARGASLGGRPRGAELVNRDHTNRLSPNQFALVLLIQVAAGVLMIGLGIGSEPFWWDEVASVSVAERSLPDIFRVFDNTDANMGFYYVLLHAWMWGGDSEAWVRALSALSVVAAIPVTAVLARRLFGDAVGLLAGFLMVGNMFVVFHAQTARGYALALLLITVATLLFVEAVRTRRAVHFFAYGAISALAVYASPLSGLVLVAHATSLPFLPRSQSLFRPFALTCGGVLLAIAPLATVMLVVGAGQVAWMDRPGLSEALDTAREMLGENGPLAAAYAAMIAIGLLALWQDSASGEQRAESERWRRSLLIGWLLLPPALLFLFSQVEPLFWSAYLLTSAPALAITAAVGLVVLARRSRALAVTAAVIVTCLVVLARIELEPVGLAKGGRDGEAAARMIATESKRGDGIAYAPGWQRLWLTWHLEHEAAPGARVPVDFTVAAEPEEVGHLYAHEVPSETLASRLRDHPRIWFVKRQGADPGGALFEAALPILQSEYRFVRSRDFGEIPVELYERK
jgi:mannosyltransferase